MKIIERINNLRHRISWLSALTGGSSSALLFWFSAARNLDHVGIGMYRGAEIVFRGHDTMAIKEVLVDQEYAKVIERIVGIDNPVVLDIGAHIGLFSLAVLTENPGARVLSVEADPQTYEILIRNVAALLAKGADWQAINAAAWEDDGKQLFFEGSGPSMSHRVSDSGKVVVTTITFKRLMDRLLEANEFVDMLKIDIEGSEEAFLCAAPELLRYVRCVVIELHPHLCNTDKVRHILCQTYDTVTEVHDRTSSKPLLICY